MERQALAKAQKSAHRGQDHALSRPSAAARAPLHAILTLQRSVGNQATRRLLQSSYLQAKLKVSQPGDRFEQEADRTAEAVMRAPATAATAPVVQTLAISRVAAGPAQKVEEEEEENLQRQEGETEEDEEEQVVARQEQDEEAEEEPLSRKECQCGEGPETPLQRQESEEPEEEKEEEEEVQTIQRAEADEDEEEPVMTARSDTEEDEETVMTVRTGGKAPAVPQGFASRLRQSSGEGQAMPGMTRSFFESRFGADFSFVRIHTGTNATKLNKSIQARAFTRANHIYVSDGAYDPSSNSGQTLLAHELTHVVQQGHAQPSGLLQRQEEAVATEEEAGPSEEQKAQALAAAARAEKAAQEAEAYGQAEVAKSKQQKAEEKETEQAAKQEARTAGGQAEEAKEKAKKRKKPEGPEMLAAPPEQAEKEEATGAEAEQKAPSSPEEDPAYQNVVKKIGGVAQKEKTHAPPQTKAAEAQAAAEAPPEEITGRAENTHAEEMEKAETPPFDAAAFKKQLLKRIEELAPKTLEEADNFKDNDKLSGVKEQMSGAVAVGKAASRGPLEEKKAEGPNLKGVEPKPVTPIPEPDPGAPPPEVGAAEAAPKAKTQGEVETPIQENTKRIGDELAQENITEKQLAESNEPQFQSALESKREAEAQAAAGPPAYRQAEQGQLGQAEEEATATAITRTRGMHAGRVEAFGQLHQMQGKTKSKDEAARLEVGQHINGIYEKARAEVERILSELDGKVEKAFDEGAEAAKKTFEDYVDAQMEAYKERRYGGWLGWARWAKDKLFGMPDDVNVFYERGRDLYLRKMDAVIDNVITIISADLTAAKAEIAKGRKEISEYLSGLPATLQAVGAEAAEKAATDFESLESKVNDKQGELVDTLANKYQEHLKAVDARIEEMKEANRGLVDKAIDAVKGVIQTIMELKKMLVSAFAKAESVVMDIIADPIGFLKLMIAAVKLGLENFVSNIEQHLQAAFIIWLTGALSSVRIQIPDDVFSLKGIFSLIVQVLGLSWDYIRAKAVKLLGEPVVKALEGGFKIFQIIMTEGLGGLWEYAKQQFSDLKEMVIEQIKGMLITQVIKAGIKWLMSLLNPVAAFIKAAIAIYDIVSFFVQKAKQIVELISGFIDAVVAIVKGGVSGAAKLIENAFAKALPLVIGLLASLLGISGLADKVQALFKSLQKRVDKFIDGLIMKAKKFAGKLMKKLSFTRKDERTETEKRNDLKLAKAEAQQALSENEATPESVRKKLPKIKKKYRLTEISLVSVGPTKFHVELAINPGDKTADEELHTGREFFSEAAKKQALEQLDKITKPEQVGSAMIELVKMEPGVLDRYKYGKKGGVLDPSEDYYIKYLEGLKEGDTFDWPLSYLRRRSAFKRGKATERNWAKKVFPDAAPKAFKVKWGRKLETVIPDIVSPNVIADVKNEAEISFREQLRAFEMVAHPEKKKFKNKVFENDGTTPVTKNRCFEIIVRGPRHSLGPSKVGSKLLDVLDKPPHAIIHDQDEE